jgi:hypothetical protein
MTKSDDTTWYEYLYGDEKEGEGHETFGEMMAEEVQDALEAGELDESRYRVKPGHRPSVKGAGWQMTEMEEVVRLRDALREEGVGDESVGVYATPRDSVGKIAELPPEHVGTQDFEYEVFVNVKQNQEAIDGGARAASGNGSGGDR